MPNDLTKKSPEETSKADVADKWLQRILTWAAIPALIATVIFNRTYLAILCFLWLMTAVGYLFIKKLRAEPPPIELRIASTLNEKLLYQSQTQAPLESKGQGFETPAPNIVCEGDEDLFVEIRREVFREIEPHNAGLRAAVVKFCNEPNPPHKVASEVNNVRAQVRFYDPRIPEFEVYRVDYGCWLNEESPYVSFNLTDKAVRYLIVAVFELITEGHGGYKPGVRIYGNSPDRTASLSRFANRFFEGYNVKVKLVVGEHGEFSKEYDFELRIQAGAAYSFEHITDEIRQHRKESARNEFIKLVAEGEAFVSTPLIDMDWDNLYSDIHKWIGKVSAFLDRHFGLAISIRFTSVGKLVPYPHKISDGRRSFFDELYTRIESLKEIAREHGAPVPASDVSKQIYEVTERRRNQILDDLAEFYTRGAALLNYQTNQPSEHERGLYIWDSEIFDYLSNNLDGADAALISDESLEEYTPPESAPEWSHDFLRRVHSRLVRLNRLFEDIQSGRRAV